MQNYEQILQDLGIEVPEDKKADLKKKMGENYKTIADYNKVVEKRDEYRQSLDSVQGKLDEFKNVNVDDLKNEISTLTQQLADEKAARAGDAAKAEIEKRVNAFLASVDEKGERLYPFLNDITESYYRTALMEELEKDSAKGRSIEDIFSAMITGDDGKQKAGIFANKADVNKARFTTELNKAGNKGTGVKYTIAELMKLKNENPNLDIRQYM